MDLARKGAWLIGSSLALALMVTPFAIGAGEGKPVKLGKRNPPKGASKTPTQVFAKTKASKYTLQLTNTRLGGAASLRCKSAVTAAPCLRSSNTAAGRAFFFHSGTGTEVGVIQSGSSFATPNPNAKPFVTNATGEATGFNSDKLDGMDAAQIIAAAQAQNPAGTAPSFAFARVTATGTTDSSRSQGVSDTNILKGATPGLYCFANLTSKPKNANVTLDSVPGEVSVDTEVNAADGCPSPATGNVELVVRTYDSAGAPTDKPFYISITGGGTA
jgi:hypothetical protein